jgi:hypothetical protein
MISVKLRVVGNSVLCFVCRVWISCISSKYVDLVLEYNVTSFEYFPEHILNLCVPGMLCSG